MRALLRRLTPRHDLTPDAQQVALPRTIGVLALPATIVVVVWALAAHDPAADVPVTLGCMGVAGVLAAVFYRLRRLTPACAAALMALDSIVIAVGIYAGRGALSPGPLFYLWVVPLSFALYGLAHALLQTAVASAAYGIVLLALPDPPGVPDVTAWVAVVLTMLVVGATVRRVMTSFRDADARFRRAFEDSTIPQALADAEHRTLQVNDALCEFLGRPREALLGTLPLAWTAPECVEASRDWLAHAKDAEPIEKGYRRPDGSLVWGRVTRSAIRDARGRLLYRHSQIEDITARRGAAVALARRARLSDASAELGRLAVELTDMEALARRAACLVAETIGVPYCMVHEALPDGTVRVLAATRPIGGHGAGAVLVPARHPLLARALEAGEALAVSDVPADPVLSRSAALTAEGITSSLSCALRRPGETFGVIVALTRETRAWAPEEIQFLDVAAAVLASALERSRAEADARRRALHDPLTGLPNRALIKERLAQALARARRGATPPAVLLLDLDGFKVVNDSLGHHAGDALLRAIAPRLTDAVRATDTVARLGGDEFVVLADGVPDEATALDLARRIERALDAPVRVDDAEHHVMASIGIALGSAAGDPDALLRDADAAMYHAKRRGRGRVELFGEPLREMAMRRLALERDLRRAVERDELELHYQPVVDLGSGQVASFEALLRWTHPEHGPIRPDEFIGIAEDSRQILAIGDWVLRAACTEAMRWPQDVGLAVNLSARQVADPDLPRRVEAVLTETGLAPGRLILEITESVIMEEAETSMRTLEALRATGIRLALDDFGTGYSSLSYLRRFPLDALKVDRSFVRDLAADPQACPLIEAVVTMAQALGLAVVAEGIETEEQRDLIRGFVGVLGQGYLLGRPVPAAGVRERLRAATIPG